MNLEFSSMLLLVQLMVHLIITVIFLYKFIYKECGSVQLKINTRLVEIIFITSIFYVLPFMGACTGIYRFLGVNDLATAIILFMMWFTSTTYIYRVSIGNVPLTKAITRNPISFKLLMLGGFILAIFLTIHGIPLITIHHLETMVTLNTAPYVLFILFMGYIFSIFLTMHLSIKMISEPKVIQRLINYIS